MKLGYVYGIKVSRQKKQNQNISRSQQNWAKAHKAGWFKDEIEPVNIKTKKGIVPMTADEHPKPQVTMEALAKLPTVFKKGEQIN